MFHNVSKICVLPPQDDCKTRKDAKNMGGPRISGNGVHMFNDGGGGGFALLILSIFFKYPMKMK